MEVLTIGTWDGEPLSLTAVADLPLLRTLRAQALWDRPQITRRTIQGNLMPPT